MAIAVGEWKRALTLAEEALAILRDQCVGVTWELNMAQNLVIWALMYLGELGELSRRLPALLANARSSGNLYIATELCTRSNYFWLAADDPDEGERVTHREHRRDGRTRDFTVSTTARCWRASRPRSIAATRTRHGGCSANWSSSFDVRISRRIQVMRIESLYLRARSALAMAATHGPTARFLSVARAGARRIASEHMPWSDPIALLLRAAIAHVEGRTPLAVRYLDDAVDRFDRADMKLYAAVARRRLGALQDDRRGRELRRQAEKWMAAQNIKNPAAMTRMLAPGFPDRP